MSLGIKLTKSHRILNFKQSNWLKSYVDINTEKRKQSSDKFSKNMYKLLNNCIFGKSIGFCILELNKLLMYQFHYNYVLKTFDNVKLLFPDTDSLVYEIKGGNVYDQCFKDKHLFDYYDDSNKKVLGKMKDEFNGVKN